ncbi:pt repeat family protein [Colletotrichum incanum]|nr:pt repeat family protein [Colletotrichum incanum]
MVSVTITYKKPGTQPPIFVAGSFSDPEWQPQEMQFTTEDGGEHTFYKNIEMPPSTQIQYKFRVGLGDWWVLNEDAPTVTDASGNRNNLLVAPESQEYKQLNGDDGEQAAKASESMEASKAAAAQSVSQLEPKPKILDHLKDEERQRLSSTPIEQVADTAAEVADSAAKLDAEEDAVRLAPLPKGVGQLKDEERKRLSSTPIEQVASVAAEVADSAQKLDADEDLEERDNTEDGPTPLFAHEALGPYEPSGSDDEDGDSKGFDHHGTVEYDVDKYDLNDPTLEHWPSNRNGIIDAVRKVETGRNEDQTTFLGAPLSPVIGSRKAGLDHYYEEAVLSSGPSSPGSTKRLELPRKSHGSMVSDRSLLSLGSIAEEDKETPNAEEANRENDGLVRVPSPAIRPTPNAFTSPASDEDEGVVMKDSKAKSKKSSESAISESPHINGESNGKHPMDLSPKTPPAQPDSPSIHVEPPEQAGESSNSQDASQAKSVAFNPAGSASTTGRDDGHKGQIKKRGASSTERPGTPSSIHSVTDSKGGWLQAFFRVLFVDWIGGLFSRLFGSKRKA